MPDEPKVLHLTIKRRWFDEILRGEKKVEYRVDKPYWNRRLDWKHFDEVHFRNGYHRDSPFMRVKLVRIEKEYLRQGPRYAITLGKILECKNV